jgi:hypothetical protein
MAHAAGLEVSDVADWSGRSYLHLDMIVCRRLGG